MNTDQNLHKPIKSYVLRCGRMTPAQQRGWQQSWDLGGLDSSQGIINPKEVFNNPGPLILEIGYGMGESLLQMAQNEPEKNFIGVEVHRPGVGNLLNQIEKLSLNNLKTYCTDGISVLQQAIPDSSLTRMQLYFADPWHKKRHHKRRIVQAEFVELVRQKLQVGGTLHMVTDWQPYAEHMLATMKTIKGYKNLSIQADGYIEKPNYRPLTKFEKRGQKLGHGIYEMLFVREL